MTCKNWSLNSHSPDTHRQFPYSFVILVTYPKGWKEVPEGRKERFSLFPQSSPCSGGKVAAIAITILNKVTFNTIGNIQSS